MSTGINQIIEEKSEQPERSGVSDLGRFKSKSAGDVSSARAM